MRHQCRFFYEETMIGEMDIDVYVNITGEGSKPVIFNQGVVTPLRSRLQRYMKRVSIKDIFRDLRVIILKRIQAISFIRFWSLCVCI